MKLSIKREMIFLVGFFASVALISIISFFIFLKTSPEFIKNHIHTYVAKNLPETKFEVGEIKVKNGFNNAVELNDVTLSKLNVGTIVFKNITFRFSPLIYLGLKKQIKIYFNDVVVEDISLPTLAEDSFKISMMAPFANASYDVDITNLTFNSFKSAPKFEKIKLRNIKNSSPFGFELAGSVDVYGTNKFLLVGEIEPKHDKDSRFWLDLSSVFKIDLGPEQKKIPSALSVVSGPLKLQIDLDQIKGTYAGTFSDDKSAFRTDLIINKDGVKFSNVDISIQPNVFDLFKLSTIPSEIKIIGQCSYDLQKWNPEFTISSTTQSEAFSLTGLIDSNGMKFENLLLLANGATVKLSGAAAGPFQLLETEKALESVYDWDVSSVSLESIPDSPNKFSSLFLNPPADILFLGTHNISISNVNLKEKQFKLKAKIHRTENSVGIDNLSVVSSLAKSPVISGKIAYESLGNGFRYKYSLNLLALDPSVFNSLVVLKNFSNTKQISGSIVGVYVSEDGQVFFDNQVDVKMLSGEIISKDYLRLFSKVYEYLPIDQKNEFDAGKFKEVIITGRISESEQSFAKLSVIGDNDSYSLSAIGKVASDKSNSTDLVVSLKDFSAQGISKFLTEYFGVNELKVRFVNKKNKIVIDDEYLFKYLGKNLFQKKNRSKLQKLFERKDDKTQKILDMILGD